MGRKVVKNWLATKLKIVEVFTTENFALAVAKQNQNASDNKKSMDKDKMWCD